jgi:pimeloyl-ACP methyl ester carboxylesterase
MKRLLTCVVAATIAAAPSFVSAELRRSGFLGIQLGPADNGVAVRGLVDGGSAKEAGVRADDVITHLNGRAVTSAPDFVAGARALRAGDTTTLDVMRGGAAVKVPVTVKPRPVESAPGIDVAYGEVSVDGHLRRTLFATPEGKQGRLPAVLFVTGVGCFSQEINDPRDSVAQLIHGLTRAGFATLRVEKTGQGDSQGPACNSPEADMNAEIRGYVAGLRALKANPRVDPDKVFLVGLSIGGIEAPLIEREEKVKGVVAINTAAKPFFEYFLETRRRQLLLKGTAHDEVDTVMARALRCNYAALIEREPMQDLLNRAPECREQVDFPAPHTFMQQWAALNMGEAWKRVDSPVLVVVGKSDFVATVEESPYLVDMLNRYKPGRATLKAIDGMDHYLTKAPSMRASQERKEPGEFEPAVLDATVAWLRRQTS